MPTEEAYLFEYRFPIAERALESESSAIALVSGRRASCERSERDGETEGSKATDHGRNREAWRM
jgi:hypothetical protein